MPRKNTIESSIPGLAKARWIAFDLDDTLHDFRKASRSAMRIVFQAIFDEYGIEPQHSEALYREILAEGTADAFTDGRASHEYRAERFSKLLEKCRIVDPDFVNELVDIYDKSLIPLLRVRPGTRRLLAKLRAQGKKVAVVSEGLADAQTKALIRLGLDRLVDLVITSNSEGVSKPNGLFQRLLDRVAANAADVCVVGDSASRDIEPAISLGCSVVHVEPRRRPDFSVPHVARVSSIMALCQYA